MGDKLVEAIVAIVTVMAKDKRILQYLIRFGLRKIQKGILKCISMRFISQFGNHSTHQ